MTEGLNQLTQQEQEAVYKPLFREILEEGCSHEGIPNLVLTNEQAELIGSNPGLQEEEFELMPNGYIILRYTEDWERGTPKITVLPTISINNSAIVYTPTFYRNSATINTLLQIRDISPGFYIPGVINQGFLTPMKFLNHNITPIISQQNSNFYRKTGVYLSDQYLRMYLSDSDASLRDDVYKKTITPKDKMIYPQQKVWEVLGDLNEDETKIYVLFYNQ